MSVTVVNKWCALKFWKIRTLGIGVLIGQFFIAYNAHVSSKHQQINTQYVWNTIMMFTVYLSLIFKWYEIYSKQRMILISVFNIVLLAQFNSIKIIVAIKASIACDKQTNIS